MATKTLTKEQWASVKEAFDKPYGLIRFKVDGYDFTIEMTITSRKITAMGFVNRVFKGEWFTQDPTHEYLLKFYPSTTRSLYSEKEKVEYKKILGVKSYNSNPYFEKTRTQYSPFFKSFAQLKRTLETNNDSIELLN